MKMYRKIISLFQIVMQSVHRSSQSEETALLKVQTNVFPILTEGSVVVLAFDAVYRHILLSRLHVL